MVSEKALFTKKKKEKKKRKNDGRLRHKTIALATQLSRGKIKIGIAYLSVTLFNEHVK